MDEDRIGLVLAKTSELKSKIISYIHKTASNVERESGESESKEPETTPDAKNQENDAEEEAESLLNIKDSLDSLEAQLSSLKALQQQQWYEKEAALAEIAYCQKTLLKELKEYKGKDLEVVHEAMAFASETEEFPSIFISRRSPLNGSAMGGLKDLHNVPNNPESKQRQSGAGRPFKSAKLL